MMKTKSNHRLILPAIIGAVTLIFIAWSTINAGSLFSFGGKLKSDDQAGSKFLGVERSSPGDVTVNLKPIEFEDGLLAVRIGIDTHNVDDLYKYDLKQITRLVIGTKSISPTSAPRLGGHHNNGKLVFNIGQIPERFSILIEGLHSKETRRFDWP